MRIAMEESSSNPELPQINKDYKDKRKQKDRERYAANKEDINRRRREVYAANKEQISKRRKEQYAEKKFQKQIENEIPSMNEGLVDVNATTLIHLEQVLALIKAGQSSTQNASNDNNSYRLHQDPRTLVLPLVPPCKYCGAYKFHRESERFCCSKGEIQLVSSVLPECLVNLITRTDTIAKDFQSMIRTYNNHFAFTSIGISCDENYERRDQGIYTVRVQGQVHHYLNDLLPHNPKSKLQGIQFYFYEPQHQVANRLSMLPRLDPTIVKKLVEILESNPYSQFLMQASQLDNINEYHIVIRSEPGLDQRRYNEPTSEEVAGIWIENEHDEETLSRLWDIRIHTKSGHSHKVQYYYGCYDPLQYVLMFPNGETGWHGNIARVGCSIRSKKTPAQMNLLEITSFDQILQSEELGVSRRTFTDIVPIYDEELATTSKTHKRTTVSCREYYVYKLQIRSNDQSFLLRFGRLLQQYIIDNYIKLESMRLAFHRMNKKKIRMEHYQGLVDSVVSGIQIGWKIGKRLYLPASFIGGPRDMRNRYLDSMALVQEFGRPDLFITMTCNANWPEIKELLQPWEESHNWNEAHQDEGNSSNETQKDDN